MNVNNISHIATTQWSSCYPLTSTRTQGTSASLASVLESLGSSGSPLLQRLAKILFNLVYAGGDAKVIEEIAKTLLDILVNTGLVSEEDANKILEKLFPDSKSDSSQTASSGTSKAHSVGGYSGAGGSGGFLWKPVSDSNGNLVVLMPSEISSEVDSVVIKDKNGNVLESGKFSAIANGGRAHFRFSKPGSAYGQNVTVEAKLKNGKVCTFQVNDTSKRCG